MQVMTSPNIIMLKQKGFAQTDTAKVMNFAHNMHALANLCQLLCDYTLLKHQNSWHLYKHMAPKDLQKKGHSTRKLPFGLQCITVILL